MIHSLIHIILVILSSILPSNAHSPTYSVVDVAKEDVEGQQSTSDESRVVYTENESNNSCVVDVDEDESSSADEGEGAATSLAYMLKYGHDIDKSGTI